ncbi:outer membrane beta-barrel protein [Corallincola spongiicola]|uniref:Outer membrane beta-barrel protein n=1 Tax=Corallincola spongiicola TaxID=2520508 RepID=A0ABY1WT52_9GAMM|nr:outer membrane beta-barrel protein [Corallincola spongiicola]TAA47761.1 hypothetical protein EXY25_00480 [Corallincola spongiicola]
MLKSKTKIALATATVISSFIPSVQSAEFDPAPYKMESGLVLTPVLETSVGYDDNVTNSDADEKDSMFTVISPSATLAGGSEVSNAVLEYGFDAGWYIDSSDDDYVDHSLKGGVHHEFTAKYRVDFDASYQRTHDARGTGISEGNEGLFDDVTKYDIYRAGGVIGVGAQSSTLKFDVRSLYEKKEYRNFDDVTQYRDFDSIEFGATSYWTIMPKTDLLFDVGYETIEYDNTEPGASSRDSDVLTVLGGVKWDITGKTDGQARIGWQDKDFDEDGREDFDGISWDVSLTWQPKQYSLFTIMTGRSAKDPDTFGDYVKETTAKGSWRHKWLERFTTDVALQYIDESYTGLDRDDEYWEASLAAIYDFRRWVRIKAEYVWSDQDSNIDSVTYDKNVFLMSVQVSL